MRTNTRSYFTTNGEACQEIDFLNFYRFHAEKSLDEDWLLRVGRIIDGHALQPPTIQEIVQATMLAAPSPTPEPTQTPTETPPPTITPTVIPTLTPSLSEFILGEWAVDGGWFIDSEEKLIKSKLIISPDQISLCSNWVIEPLPTDSCLDTSWSLSGDQFSFTYTIESTVTWAGTITGSVINGTLQSSAGITGWWKAIKIK